MTHEETLLQLHSLTKRPPESVAKTQQLLPQPGVKCCQPQQDHCCSLLRKGSVAQRKGTCLGDAVVVCQEHGEVLGLLDGLGVCHLPQELGSSGRDKSNITKGRSASVRLSPPTFPV